MAVVSKIVFDEPAWWRRPGWQAIMAALLALAAWAIWWTALTPVDHDPIVARPAPAPVAVARTVSPEPAPTAPVPPVAPAVTQPAPAMPNPAAAPPTPFVPPLPTGRVPGARVTPLNLPPDMLQVTPEQPSEDNLEN